MTLVLRILVSIPLAVACTFCGDDGASGDEGPPPGLCELALVCDARIVDEPKTTCMFRLVDDQGRANFEGWAGVEIRGRSSQNFPKKSYAIELRDIAGDEAPADLLGMGIESDFVLDGSWLDRSLMRNALAYDTFRALSSQNYAAEGRFCQLTLNEEYVGIYRLVERVKRAQSRIDLSADDGQGSTFVIKQDDAGAIHWDVGEQSRWKLVYPREDRATPEQVMGVQSFVDALDDALRQVRDGGDDERLFELLDLDAMVDWVIVQELAKNVDAYNLSLHFYRNAGGPARPVPWDFDFSMGQPIISGTEQASASGWTRHDWLPAQALGASPRFRARLVERYGAHRAAALSTAQLMARLDRYLVTLTQEARDNNFLRWPLQDVQLRGSLGPYELYMVSSYADEVEQLRAWILERLNFLDAHISDFPN